MNSELTRIVDRLIETACGLGFVQADGRQDRIEDTKRYLVRDRAALVAYLDGERPPLGDQIGAIASRAEAATPGPWRWFGHGRNQAPYLATPDRGRLCIMTFGRLGMQQAQPWFRVGSRLEPAREIAIYEVARDATDESDPRLYRHDIVGFRSPDAEFIAAARQDVDVLLERIRTLQAELDDLHRVNAEGRAA